MLEALAFKAPGGLSRISVAALGRMAGVGRSTALRVVQRLERIGAVVRVGPSIMLNTASVLKWLAAGCMERARACRQRYLAEKERARRRREAAKALKEKAESESVAYHATHRERIYNSGADAGWLVPERAQALAELSATYVPVHLRGKKNG